MTQYPLEVDDDLWKEFKGLVTKNQTINDKLVELIEEAVNGQS